MPAWAVRAGRPGALEVQGLLLSEVSSARRGEGELLAGRTGLEGLI